MANAPRKSGKDIEELESTFQKLSGTSASKKQVKKSSSPIVPVLITAICILAIAAVICAIVILTMNGSSVKANVSIMGIELKGMSQNEVIEAISAEFDRLYGSEPLVVEIEDHQLVLSATDSGLTLDAQAAADAAIHYKQAGLKTVALDIAPYISINEHTLADKIDELALTLNSELTQTQYEVTGTAPESLEAMDEEASQILHINKGTPGKKLDKDLIWEQVCLACSNGQSNITYELPFSEPDPLDVQAIFDEYCSTAVTAEFEKDTFKPLGGTFGYGFDVAEVTAALDTADYGSSLEFPFQWTEPETTLEELNAQLFQDELGTYTATQYSDWRRQKNMRVACESIHNTILYPGDVFSFNGALGPRTPEKGYELGASYVGGKTVMEYGGGICQVSSSLYYCSLLADLQIVERDCHTYAPTYVPLSGDATVYWGGIDYKFKNNTPYPIRIEAIANGNSVTLRLMGTDTKDYYVKFKSVHLNTYEFKEVFKEMAPDNEDGYKDGDVITTPYTGYRSEGWIIKYDKLTDQEISRTKVSSDLYHTRDKEIAKIIEPEETEGETEPEVTEPEQTDPPVSEPTQTEPEVSEPSQTEDGSGAIQLPPISG